MNLKLKQYLVDNLGLAADADEATSKAHLHEKLKSGELNMEKYEELLTVKTVDKADELAQKTAAATAQALSPALEAIAKALAGKPETKATEKPVEAPVDHAKSLADMEARLIEKLSRQALGGDGAKLMEMGAEMDDAANIRVKSKVEQWSHTPTALTYKSANSRLIGVHGMPMQFNGKDVDAPTERSKGMAAVWLKFQLFPEQLKDWEVDVIRHILHKEKFTIPNADGNTDARYLSEGERQAVWDTNKNFYARGLKSVINDSTSGGQYATPEFFDYDMIVTPTLAQENIMSYCNVVPVPRGTAAQNFTMGRPTIAASNTEGSATNVFTTTSFIGNHDTTFYRAAGFISIGRNFAEDAHPRLVQEIQMQYSNSVNLWFNEQIMGGDGTTEPQGVLTASGTADITPSNPTTGAVTLSDVFNLRFGVNKAYRHNGGIQNAIYVMSDTTYKRLRAVATGVTGDTRLVFGDDVESYTLFGSPVLIEETSMGNTNAAFFQAKGYRLYLRQGARFIREDRGDTLVRANTFIVGVDLRAGGQLDLGGYAAVIDSFPA